MSNQHKVQSYLQKYNITHLFETMMSSLVKDMPADPYECLITMVNLQKQKMARKTAAGEGGDTKSSTTSVWASNAERSYEKPWKANAKVKSKRTSQHLEKEDWDGTVKLTTKSFDELNLSKISRKLSHTSQTNELFPATSDVQRDCHMTEEQLLQDELPSVTRDKEISQPTEQSSDIISRGHSKQRGPKADAARHQAELAAFLEAKRSKVTAAGSGSDSGVQADSSDEETAAYSVYENPADLADEGITVKASLSSPQVKPVSSTPEPLIHMTVCPQCAKVVSNADDRVSSVASSNGSQLTNRSQRTDSSTGRRLPQSGVNPKASQSRQAHLRSTAAAGGADRTLKTNRTGFSSYYGDEEDDEFESVSQVSGDRPRMPVWGTADGDGGSPPTRESGIFPRKLKERGTSKASTLKRDLLQQLPQSSNTVEQFLGGHTWPQSPTEPQPIHAASRQQKATSDVLRGDNSGGWNLDYNSEDDSTVVN